MVAAGEGHEQACAKSLRRKGSDFSWAQKAVEASWTFGYKSPDAISGVISLYDDRFWTSGGCPQYSKDQFSVYDDRP